LAEHIFETFLITWEQNRPVEFEKNIPHVKHNMCRMMILCVSGTSMNNRKTGKLLFYTSKELFKKIPCLCTFCTQSVNEGLT